jgi:tRNA-dihydrouridine synthase B
MIGRAAQGKPWIFKQILERHADTECHYSPTMSEVQSIINNHLENLYSFYGNISGVRIARKHIAWYFDKLGSIPTANKKEINQAQHPAQQLALVNLSFKFITQSAA